MSKDAAINSFHLTTDHERSEGGRPVLVDGKGMAYHPNEGVHIEVAFTAVTHQQMQSAPLTTAREFVQYWLDHPPRDRDWTEDGREAMSAYLSGR